MNSAQDFMNLFLDETGEFLYFIAIFVMYQAGLLMAIGQRTRSKQEVAASRYSAALLVVILAWLAMMAGALYDIAQSDTPTLLPPLERAANLTILTALMWAFLQAEAHDGADMRLMNRFAQGMGMLILGFLALSIMTWDTSDDFNQIPVGDWWLIAPILVGLMAILFLASRYSFAADLPLKMLFFIVVVAGHGYGLYQSFNDELTGNDVGVVRWVMLVGSSLMVIIVYRMVMERMLNVIDEVATYAETVSQPIRTIQVQPAPNEVTSLSEKVQGQTAGTSALGGRNQLMELLKALGTMLNNPDTDNLPRQIVMAVAQSFKADVVAVMVSDQPQWAQIIAAYDTINENRVDGMLMHLSDQTSLVQALQTNRLQTLTIEDNQNELNDFYKRIDVNLIGPAYIQPLSREGKVVGILFIGYPYTHLKLRQDDIRLLESIAPIAARLMVITRNAIQQRTEAEERAIQAIVDNEIGEIAAENRAQKEALQANLEQAHIQIRELNTMVHALEEDLGKERDRIEDLIKHEGDDAMSVTQRMNVLSLEREQLRSERENLTNALIEAKASLNSITAEDDMQVYQGMMEDLQQQYQDLQAEKQRLEKQLSTIRSATDTSQASTKLNEIVETLNEEKAEIEAERDLLVSQLQQTRTQLEALGIEGGIMGLARQLAQLTEDRLYYKALAERATQEREALVNERRNLEENISAETQRSSRIQALEQQLARLVQDREALIKSRDSLKIEREAFLSERDTWRGDRARMIAHNDSLKMELDETLDLLKHANEQRQELAARVNELGTTYDQLRASLTRTTNERDALLARIEGDRERLREVGAEGVGALTKMIDEITQERAELEAKVLDMQNQLQNLKWEHIQLQGSDQPVAPNKHMDVGTIYALAQELTSPVSATSHYVDVMLGESVGVLSDLQLQFMNRIKANVDRLNRLMADLVQATSLLDSGTLDLDPQPVNLVDIIDETITDSRFKFSEKGIILDLDLQGDALPIEADANAMKQVFRHLVDNAYLVSPNDSSVRVSARYHQNGLEQIMVEITDHGGGVMPDLYDVVFSRVNRRDNAIIDGLGHSGVELSLVKGLIEAHNGKIWLETQEGVGTTFKFTIPTSYED